MKSATQDRHWPDRPYPKIGIGQTKHTLATLGQTKHILTTIGQTEQNHGQTVVQTIGQTVVQTVGQTEKTLCQTVVQTVGQTLVHTIGQTEQTFGQTVVQTIGQTFLTLSLNFDECCFIVKPTKQYSLHGEIGKSFRPLHEGLFDPSKHARGAVSNHEENYLNFFLSLKIAKKKWVIFKQFANIS